MVIAGATYTNPFTGVVGDMPGFGTNGIGVGDRIYIYRLPLGSFTPSQTTAASLTVPMSNGADVGTALGMGMDAHFRDGTLPVGGTILTTDLTGTTAVTRYATSDGGGDLTDPAVVPGRPIRRTRPA